MAGQWVECAAKKRDDGRPGGRLYLREVMGDHPPLEFNHNGRAEVHPANLISVGDDGEDKVTKRTAKQIADAVCKAIDGVKATDGPGPDYVEPTEGSDEEGGDS